MSDRGPGDLAVRMNNAVEAPIHHDQQEVELRYLATLATLINSDVADLKYEMLNLTPTDFHFRDHRAIFIAMKELCDAGELVDQITVRAKVGDTWLETIQAVFDETRADISSAKTFKRKIILWSFGEKVVGVLQSFETSVEAAVNDQDTTLPDLVAVLQKSIFDIGKMDSLSPPLRSEAELIDAFLEDLESPNPGYRMGFDMLETIIGGLKPGLFILSGTPSAGKTTFAKQLADGIAELNEVPVLYFCYEQSAAELRVKTLTRLTKKAGAPLCNEWIKSGGVPEQVKAAAEQYKLFGKWLKIIEADQRDTVERIRFLAQQEKHRTGKDPVIIIDYAQVMPAPSLNDKRAEVEYLVSELRRIARDLQVHVFAISSMSRSEYKRKTMSGFKETGSIEYTADIAALLTVESENEDGTLRVVALNIVKNRNGRRGKVGMNYYTPYDLFEENDRENLNYLTTLGVDPES